MTPVRDRQAFSVVSHVRKAADNLILARDKHAFGTPTSGAHRLIVSIWSGMGCAMSGDLALTQHLSADNTLGKDKL